MEPVTWKICDRLGWLWNRMGFDARTKVSTQYRAMVNDLLINECSEPMLQLYQSVDQGVVMTLGRPGPVQKS